MNRSTLPRHARAHTPGWIRPYADPFTVYAGGDEEVETAAKEEGDEDEKPTDEEGDEEEKPADNDGQEPDPDGADDLGDKGKRALDAMKGKLRAEREKRRAAEAKLQPENDGSAAHVQAQADQAAAAKANARILRSEIKAAATGKLINPKDALTFLNLEQFEVDDDGQVDEDEIADAIEDLLKERPYLAAATATRFQGTGDGGAARKAGRPKQLTRADLKTMSAEAIDKAREDGRLDDLMGGK